MKKTIRKNERGITLIALVITIIVLIILAAISLMMLSGNDGILSRAGNAKITIGQANAEEEVKRAILALQIDGKGSNNGITPAKIAEQVNKDNGRTDVTAEGENFPTNIVYEDGTKVYVKLDLTVGSADDVVEPGLYPINNVTESQIAPSDLFTYKPLTTGENNTQVASTNGLSNLPKKTIRITGIKDEYCWSSLDNGYYGLTYKTDSFILADTLIIPYQVVYEGEMYTVTEVDLTTKSYGVNSQGKRLVYGVIFPNIGNVIYPNTVTKILRGGEGGFDSIGNFPNNYNGIKSIIKNIVLPSSLTEIGSEFDGIATKSITIPTSITKIGRLSGNGDSNITINYMGNEEQWNKIEVEGSIKSDKINYNYEFGKEERTYTTEEKEMLKQLNDVFVKKQNYFDKVESGLYTSKDKELKDLIGYKDFQEYYEARVLDSVKEYYNRNYLDIKDYSECLKIVKTIPTDENEKWNKLTEMFIKGEINSLIENGHLPAGTKANSLAELWKLKKDADLGDYTKYTTLKDYFNGENRYGFESFLDSIIRTYKDAIFNDIAE